jgi:hypothetical protein
MSEKSNNFLAAFSAILSMFTLMFIYNCTVWTSTEKLKENPVLAIEKIQVFEDFTLKSYKFDETRLENSQSQQIFFLETHLEGRRSIKNARQACSVEAAGKNTAHSC